MSAPRNFARNAKDSADKIGAVDFGANGVKADAIAESTSAAGVTIDGVQLKDSAVVVDTISEKTASSGVTIDSTTIKDGGVSLAAAGLLTLGTPGLLNASGSTQANAIANAPISKMVTVVSGADNAKGIALPAAAAGGMHVIVNPAASSAVLLWPAVNDKINGGTANSSVTVPAVTGCIAVAYDATDWYLIPKTPS